MLLFYESTYIFIRLSLRVYLKNDKFRSPKGITGRHYCIFSSPGTKPYVSPTGNLQLRLEKRKVHVRETYNQQVRFSLNEGRLSVFYHTKSTARIPSPTATMVEISPGIMKEWFSTYFPMRVVPVVSKLMAATTVG